MLGSSILRLAQCSHDYHWPISAQRADHVTGASKPLTAVRLTLLWRLAGAHYTNMHSTDTWPWCPCVTFRLRLQTGTAGSSMHMITW